MAIERSVLAVPGSSERMIQKAAASDADAVVIDLQDAVAPDAKVDAREIVSSAIASLDWGNTTRMFRINGLDTPYFFRDVIDIVEACGEHLDAIVIPMVNRPEDVYVIDTLLTQVEAGAGLTRRIGLEALIESSHGVMNCEAIARSSDRLVSLIFGPGDFAASVRMPSGSIGAMDEWDDVYPGHRNHYAMNRMLIAARAAGIQAIDGPFANFRDEDGLRRSCLIARSMGFDGKWCIHPAQIEQTNAVFAPEPDEVEWAQRVIAAYEAAYQQGLGAVSLDNKMIDAANIRMAQNTIDRARAAGMLSV